MSEPEDEGLERSPKIERLRTLLRRRHEPERQAVADLVHRAQQTVVVRDLVSFGFVQLLRTIMTVLGTVFATAHHLAPHARVDPTLAPAPTGSRQPPKRS